MREITLSASRLKTYLMCPFKYFLQYVVRLPHEDSFATLNGTAVHSTIEKYFCGHKKRWKYELLNRMIRDRGWQLHKHYSKKCECCIKLDECVVLKDIVNMVEDHTYCCSTMEDMRKFIECVDKLIARKDSPLKGEVISLEEKFMLRLSKRVKITGFIDCILKIDDTTIEIRDWKTGSYVPPYKDLVADPQLKIYDLAVSIIYPQYNVRVLTFDYLKNRPYTFTISDKERQENKLWLIDMGNQILDENNFERKYKYPLHKLFPCKVMCSPQDCSAYYKSRDVIYNGYLKDFNNG